MHRASKQTRETVERLVVIDLLGQTRGHTRETLFQNLRHHDQATVNAAIDGLIDIGILVSHGERVAPSRAFAHLDALGVIAI
jgi:hypothetical protein